MGNGKLASKMTIREFAEKVWSYAKCGGHGKGFNFGHVWDLDNQCISGDRYNISVVVVAKRTIIIANKYSDESVPFCFECSGFMLNDSHRFIQAFTEYLEKECFFWDVYVCKDMVSCETSCDKGAWKEMRLESFAEYIYENSDRCSTIVFDAGNHNGNEFTGKWFQIVNPTWVCNSKEGGAMFVYTADALTSAESFVDKVKTYLYKHGFNKYVYVGWQW